LTFKPHAAARQLFRHACSSHESSDASFVPLADMADLAKQALRNVPVRAPSRHFAQRASNAVLGTSVLTELALVAQWLDVGDVI
jgi:hypothetical protein